MKRTNLTTIGLFVLLVGVGVASRLIKEVWPALPPNFHAIAATTLFAGFLLPSRRLAAVVPLAAMVLSDLIIGGYEPLVMLTVYAALVVPIGWRGWLRHKLSPIRLTGATVASSLVFFTATNLAVWYQWYPHTAAALARCYASALPFLSYTLAGDLLFTGGLFGIYALLAMARAPQPTAASASA